MIAGIKQRLERFYSPVAAIVLAGFLLLVPGLVIPGLQRAFTDFYLVAGLHDWLWWLLGGMAGAAALRMLLTWLQQYNLARFNVRLGLISNGRLLWHILHMPMNFFAQRNSGELANRAALGDRLSSLMSGSLLIAIVNLLAITVYGAVMLSYDLLLTSMVIAFAALNLLLLMVMTQHLSNAHRRMLQEEARLQALLYQGFASIESFRASGTEDVFFRRWAGAHAKVVSAEQAMTRWRRLLTNLVTLLTTVTGVAIVLVGGVRVMEGTITVGMLVAFQTLMANFNGPVASFVGLGAQLQDARGYIDRLDDVLRQKTDALFAPDRVVAPLTRLHGRVEIEQLNFSYSGVGQAFFRGINLSVAPGARVAVVGPSGSGKSTLGRLIVGLALPQSGRILFDGVPIETIDNHQLRTAIAYVEQSVTLFPGTIRDNITMWDQTSTEERMVQAAKDAMLHEAIAARPNAYDSPLDEEGAQFQRRRAAAPGDRPGAGDRSQGSRARRGDERARRHGREGDPRQHPAARLHLHHDLAPAQRDPRLRRHRGARSRHHRRARAARRAACEGRALPQAGRSMSAAVQTTQPGTTLPDKTLEAGVALLLDQPETGWLLRSGAVELYATLWHDGAAISGRHYLFTLKAGELILPLLCAIDGLMISAVATEDAALFPLPARFLAEIANIKERQPIVAVQLDRWIHGIGDALAPIIGAVPTGAVAHGIGEKFAVAAGDVVTTRSEVAWIVSPDGAELAYPDGDAVMTIEAVQATPVPPGLWLTAQRAATALTVNSATALQHRGWSDILEGFHHKAFTTILHHLEAREAAAIDQVQDRADRTARTLDRTIGRFAGLLDHAAAWTGASAPDEKLLGPFVMIAEALGIELSQQVRRAIARATTIEDAARIARVRQRQIALRGSWWRQDFGPFIGFLDDARRPVAVLPAGPGRYRIVDPDGGADLTVTAAVAARLAPMAHMLYRSLAAKPLEFKDLIALGWKQNRGDFYIAIAASLIIGILGLATPVAMRLAFDRFIPSHETFQLAELAIGLFLVALITTGFRAAYDMAFLRIDGRMSGQTQAAVIDRVLRLPNNALRFGSADIAQRATSAETVRRGAVNFMLGSLAAAFMWICNGALLFYYAPLAALAACGCFLVLLAIAYVCARRQLEAIRRGEELLSNVNTIVFHLVSGITVLRTTGSEGRAFARWGQDFAEMRARSHRAQSIGRIFEVCLAGFDVLTMAGVFLLLSYLPSKEFSTGSFISFIAAYGAFMAASGQLARGVSSVINMKPSWERAAPLFKAVPEGGATKRDPGTLTGAVELTNIAFRYSMDAPYVLQGLEPQGRGRRVHRHRRRLGLGQVDGDAHAARLRDAACRHRAI